MEKSKKIKYVIYFIILIMLCIWFTSIFVTYMVNNWHSNSESWIDDDYYKYIYELEELGKNEEKKNIFQNVFNFIIPNTHANYYNEIVFNKETFQLLEKYYILWKFDTTNIPTEIFHYWIIHWDELPHILNSYDYLNKTKHLQGFVNLKRQFGEKKFYQETIRQDLRLIIVNYLKNKEIKNDITFLPKDIHEDENYQFMINGLKNNKSLINNSKKIWQDLWFDYNLTLAAILTEQFRYAGTYRWFVKQQITKTPFIFSMTQFSYWIGWIKEKTGEKIKEDAILYGHANVFELQQDDKYKNKSKKELLQDGFWETVYPNILIKNIITRWERSWNSISTKPWIIITLYNFWNDSNKKPHGNPKVGGAIIKLNEDKEREYTFWWLWESLYYYIKVYNLY
jgi:hypothetical protein